MTFEYNANSETVNVQVVRVGSIVNLYIPNMIFPSAAAADTVHAITSMPTRFIPACTVRGAASTVLSDNCVAGSSTNCSCLGEFEVNPLGFIIIGIPGGTIAPAALGPQPFTSATTAGAQVDINTITYNLHGSCACPPPIVG